MRRGDHYEIRAANGQVTELTIRQFAQHQPDSYGENITGRIAFSRKVDGAGGKTFPRSGAYESGLAIVSDMIVGKTYFFSIWHIQCESVPAIAELASSRGVLKRITRNQNGSISECVLSDSEHIKEGYNLNTTFWEKPGGQSAIYQEMFIMTGDLTAEDRCSPGIYDPAHIVQSDDCYTWAEFNKAMKAEKQQPILAGNRRSGANLIAEYFTSNPNGSKGFNAVLDVAYNNKENAQTVRIRAVYTDLKINDVNANAIIPSWGMLTFSGSGDYAGKLRDAYSAGQRAMMLSQTVHSPTPDGNWREGQQLMVMRDMNTGAAHILAISAQGSVSPLFDMETISYTQFARRFVVGSSAP